ncbi:hypothetical protein [Bacillus sp. FJAT-45350]|uniref:hypothetical protein n=1 Tax=Bacillus sp. FJAT-45350 TaxID=2011014 RepID=UPI000BB75ADC|nr:hypothetical protein [Bacillus sp. FJAT-45350]
MLNKGALYLIRPVGESKKFVYVSLLNSKSTNAHFAILQANYFELLEEPEEVETEIKGFRQLSLF